ncbi:MAG: hypothetical protein PVJ25_02745 [Desulfuromonadales bacterium]|jgi:hypothetical protein
MHKNISFALLCVITFLTLAASAFAAPLVLFDEAHAQQFVIGKEGPLDLSELAAAYRANGFQVKTSAGPLTDAELAAADLLILSGPFRPLDTVEVEAVLDFLRKGGGLAVMLHIPPPALNLLRQLHVEVANGTLHEEGAAIDANPLYIKVSRLAEHPVTAGLESFSVYGCWALRGAAEHVEVLAETGPHGWVDLDQDRQFTGADAMQSFGVLVAGQLGQGRYVVFGDDTLFQNRFFDEHNRQLAVNLVNWLSGK